MARTGNAKRKKNKPIRVMAFTITYSGKTNRIVTDLGLTPSFDPKDYPLDGMPYQITQKKALWDTGATNSVVTRATAQEMGLIPIGVGTVNHAGGTSTSPRYLVNIYLPNKVAIIGVIVSECEDIAGNFGAIIGMDVISRGDLAITNNNGITKMTFQTPSIYDIDFVKKKAG